MDRLFRHNGLQTNYYISVSILAGQATSKGIDFDLHYWIGGRVVVEPRNWIIFSALVGRPTNYYIPVPKLAGQTTSKGVKPAKADFNDYFKSKARSTGRMAHPSIAGLIYHFITSQPF